MDTFLSLMETLKSMQPKADGSDPGEEYVAVVAIKIRPAQSNGETASLSHSESVLLTLKETFRAKFRGTDDFSCRAPDEFLVTLDGIERENLLAVQVSVKERFQKLAQDLRPIGFWFEMRVGAATELSAFKEKVLALIAQKAVKMAEPVLVKVEKSKKKGSTSKSPRQP